MTRSSSLRRKTTWQIVKFQRYRKVTRQLAFVPYPSLRPVPNQSTLSSMLTSIENRQTDSGTDLRRHDPGRVNPKLTKSLQALNDSLTTFKTIYANHRERMKYPNVLDDNALDEVLQQTMVGNDVFRNAAILEDRIFSMFHPQPECEHETTRRRSSCLYVAKLFPLVKLLADVGTLAAQVSLFHLLIIMVFRFLDGFRLLLLYEGYFW